MREIIKYQLKGQKNTILLMLAILGILNVVAFGFEVYEFASGVRNFTPTVGFWIPIALGTTVIVPIVMFFLCSSGHVSHLLYRDTNYLMLTIPRHGWEILGGRLVAGLVEFLAYAIPAALFLTVHMAVMGVYASSGQTGFFAALGYIYRQLFVVNFLTGLKLAILMLCSFAIVGCTITFAVVASRSFVKTKKLATVAAIVVFCIVGNWTTKLGDSISAKFGWFIRVPFAMEPGMAHAGPWGSGDMTFRMQDLTIPLAPFVMYLIIAAALFAGSSWLMEKKVEL